MLPLRDNDSVMHCGIVKGTLGWLLSRIVGAIKRAAADKRGYATIRWPWTCRNFRWTGRCLSLKMYATTMIITCTLGKRFADEGHGSSVCSSRRKSRYLRLAYFRNAACGCVNMFAVSRRCSWKRIPSMWRNGQFIIISFASRHTFLITVTSVFSDQEVSPLFLSRNINILMNIWN